MIFNKKSKKTEKSIKSLIDAREYFTNKDLLSFDAEIYSTLDLHIHTCFSDGDMTPSEIVRDWINKGCKTIAITDHDGLEGSIIGMDESIGRGIHFVSGIEIDSCIEDMKDIHILGYGIEYSEEKLNKTLFEMLMWRARRNDELRYELIKLGYNVCIDDLINVNEGRFIGKNTFAKVLCNKGYATDVSNVFNEIFRNNDSIRNIHKKTLSSPCAIDMIHEAGGLAIIAHPMENRHLGESIDAFMPRIERFLKEAIEWGIDGIEVFHPSADLFQRRFLLEFVEKHDLIATAGSDFHSYARNRDFSRYHST